MNWFELFRNGFAQLMYMLLPHDGVISNLFETRNGNSRNDILQKRADKDKMHRLGNLLPALAIFCLVLLRVTVFATSGKWKSSHKHMNGQSSIHNFRKFLLDCYVYWQQHLSSVIIH